MIDKSSLEKGWKYAADSEGTYAGTFCGHQYVSAVAEAIDDLERAINSHSGSKQGTPQLAGYIAEDWHAGTFNIKAVAADSSHRAVVEHSQAHASPDISTNFDSKYSLKYLKYADKSVRAQAKNVIQNYNEYLSKAKANETQSPMTFDEYLEKYDYSDDLSNLLMSVYRGQGRIIPSDQLEDAIQKLQRMIATESARGTENRLLNLKNYEETLQNLSDRIKDGDGIESVKLSKVEAETIADLCRTGDFRPSDFGITLSSEITRQYILEQALKSGITATTINLAIQLVPELVDIIYKLVLDKEIDVSQLKRDGFRTVTSTGKSFILGYISCGLYMVCKTGRLGKSFVNIDPSALGTVVALSISVMQETFDYARGKIDVQQLRSNITKDAALSVSALAGGAIAVAILPVANTFAFLLGSMAGSVIASITLTATEKILVSFCAETGFTLFGLVKQDYTLPSEVLQEMGLSIANLHYTQLHTPKLNRSTLSVSSLARANLRTIDVRILKRGVISFNCVGYVFD